jgi:hypothetical protein
MNGLRELRMARHGAAVLSQGLTPLEALSVRTPYMASLFGWESAIDDVEGLRPAWAAAEAATDQGFGQAFGALSDAERDEFVALASAAQAAACAAAA